MHSTIACLLSLPFVYLLWVTILHHHLSPPYDTIKVLSNGTLVRELLAGPTLTTTSPNGNFIKVPLETYIYIQSGPSYGTLAGESLSGPPVFYCHPYYTQKDPSSGTLVRELPAGPTSPGPHHPAFIKLVCWELNASHSRPLFSIFAVIHFWWDLVRGHHSGVTSRARAPLMC